MDVLHPLSAGLIRGIHIDSRHQFTESIGGEFFNMDVLVRFLDELFNILNLLFLYFDFLLDRETVLFQLLLLGIVTLAHHVEAGIAQLSTGVVLVDFHEQPFEICDSLLISGKLLLQDSQLFAAFHPKLFLHDLAEVVFMAKDVVCHLLDMVQHTAFQNLYPDEVSLAPAPVLLVQRAIKEVLTEVPVIGRTILHLGTAVSTVDHTGENAALACPGHAVTLITNLLNLFKHIIVDNALMCIREDSLIFHRIQMFLFIPDRVSIGLEVDCAASVLPAFQNQTYLALAEVTKES